MTKNKLMVRGQTFEKGGKHCLWKVGGRDISQGGRMQKYVKLRRRVEALHQGHNERYDIFGDGSVLLSGAEIRLLMESLDGSSRGLPSQRGIRND